ncbi:MAG: tRNA (adenosine(37)-N6)-threonylcarbamoyltransferase complex ATPase subunit type 1 TsaE [Rikenellaceae bacterium]
MKEITINTLAELRQVAEAILESLDGRTVVLLHGSMGAGKTTLVREIAAVLGSEDSVSSPTFAIVNEYIDRDNNSIYHFDMYRIERIEEAIDLGFEEYITSGNLCLIEWAERVEELLPEDAMLVRIEAPTATERRFIIE